MVGKFKVITLCGSTRFKDQFLEAQKRLTLEGNIVISVGLFGHSGDVEVWSEGTKAMPGRREDVCCAGRNGLRFIQGLFATTQILLDLMTRLGSEARTLQNGFENKLLRDILEAKKEGKYFEKYPE